MQKKEIKRKKPNTTTNKKSTNTKTQQIKKRVPVKKRVPAKKTTTNNNKIANTQIKKRIAPKNVKEEKNYKIAALAILIITIIIFYIIFGIMYAAIATIGAAIIIGIGTFHKKGKGKKSKLGNLLLIIILTLGIIGIIAFGGFFLYIKSISDPQFEEKEKELSTPETTILYDNNQNIITKLGTEQRTKVKYSDLPDVLIDAIIATEDSRFFQHNGFDAPRFIKAAIGQVTGNSDAGGASTLTMQVVKNTFTNAKVDSGLAGVIRKFQDIYISIFKLEKEYTKEAIIEFYVNNHFLGGNIYGVAEASEVYFGKSVSELNLSEAAILAGMFKSPNYYRPNVNPANAEKRQDTVLYLMERHGYITKEERQIAASIPVESLTATKNVTTEKYQGYIDTVVDEIQKKYGVNPYTTSLKLYTNLDRTKQDAVNSVLNGEAYSWINDKVQCGVAVLDTQTGKILDVGNGRNIVTRASTTIDQFNYARKTTWFYCKTTI